MAWGTAGSKTTPELSMGIRTKLLLASLTLLVIPWLGYQYIQGLESYLRDSHEEKLLDRVSIMAAVMNEQQQLLASRNSDTGSDNPQSHLYVRPLQTAIQLDGYLDDWRHYQNREQPLGEPSGDLKVAQRIGHYRQHLYIALRIDDDSIIYRAPDSLRLDRSDHLRIGMLDNDGKFQRYQISTIAPGWVNAYQMPRQGRTSGNLPLKPEPRIKGEWQPHQGGYTVELRIPLSMLGDKLAIAVADVDDPTSRHVENIVASTHTEQADQLGTIVIPSPQMEALLNRLQRANQRIWVIDPNYRVIGIADTLGISNSSADDPRPTLLSGLMRLFYQLVLTQPSDNFTNPLSSASTLDNPAVAAALNGTPQTYWQATENESISITIAAHPIYIGETIVGAIAIEESSDSILLLQNRVIEAMANISILAFILTVGVLLLFATRLTLRIHRLRNEVDASIGDDGRVQQVDLHSGASDEIGDLSRSFSDMLQRLAQYNRYLETMASKLSHELRTPITIVRSSLDSMDKAKLDEQSLTYIKRANEGTARLNNILTRMSEATRLEQTILHEAREQYSATTIIEACIEGYRLVHPTQCFDYQSNETSSHTTIDGSPELLAQLLDKLVDNAVDFAKPDSAITISIDSNGKELSISIHNEGPHLPEEMRTNLFDSMVSLRQHKTDSPHLGLGLYIVRLIVDFHNGRIEADNTNTPEGVVFKITIPLANRS